MARLKFHREAYSKAALDEASEVFAEHASIETTESAPYLEVELEPKEGVEAAELEGEFMNYVLALTIEEKRAG